jgi:hypothetical protein
MFVVPIKQRVDTNNGVGKNADGGSTREIMGVVF